VGSSVELIFSCCKDEVNDQFGRLCDEVVAVRHLERLPARAERVRKPCSALWAAIRRARLPPHRVLHPEGDRARHITFRRQLGVCPATLVVRRSRVARLGGARFDAQYVDVDQARLVSVEL
jgi:hypothetical protein